MDGTSVGAVTSYPFSNVTANHTIAATFALNTYTITASAGSNGSISPSGPVSVNSAAQARPLRSLRPQATRWRASRWTEPRSGQSRATLSQCHGQPHNRSDICPKYLHHHGLCRFKRLDLTFGLGLRELGGASQTFTITPATGYQVASVTVDGTSVGAVTSYTFPNVTANHTIAATFALNTYTITPSAGAQTARSRLRVRSP